VNFADLYIRPTPTKSAPVFLPNDSLQVNIGNAMRTSGNMSEQNNIGINVNVICSAGFRAPQSLHRATEEWKTFSSAYPLFKLVQHAACQPKLLLGGSQWPQGHSTRYRNFKQTNTNAAKKEVMQIGQ